MNHEQYQAILGRDASAPLPLPNTVNQIVQNQMDDMTQGSARWSRNPYRWRDEGHDDPGSDFDAEDNDALAKAPHLPGYYGAKQPPTKGTAAQYTGGHDRQQPFATNADDLLPLPNTVETIVNERRNYQRQG
jgi:hypothetical protein